MFVSALASNKLALVPTEAVLELDELVNIFCMMASILDGAGSLLAAGSGWQESQCLHLRHKGSSSGPKDGSTVKRRQGQRLPVFSLRSVQVEGVESLDGMAGERMMYGGYERKVEEQKQIDLD